MSRELAYKELATLIASGNVTRRRAISIVMTKYSLSKGTVADWAYQSRRPIGTALLDMSPPKVTTLQYKDTVEYWDGYIRGAFVGDGWYKYDESGNVIKASIRVNNKAFAEAIQEGLERAFGYVVAPRVVPNQGGNIHYQFNWIPENVRRVLRAPPVTPEERRGYVAGFYDAEGCFSKHTHTNNWNLTLPQRKKAPLDLIASILDEYGFHYSLLEHGKNSISRWTIRVSSSLGDNAGNKRFFATFNPKKGR